ncbi:NAD-dependent epimerase/dehydratase family protein [Streptomyces mirabilis]|uniref:NAD-dependent epimerase/dehydratase family protein n=1 Tax=Streptomyces mirabilis TaxID=68239 RepID=UPI003F4C6E7E
MKIIAIGATGTIGRAVADALETEHEVIRASRDSSPRVDLEIPASIDALFDTVGKVDAVICCAASGQLTPLTSPSDDEFTLGLKGNLLGQVKLLRRALDHVRTAGPSRSPAESSKSPRQAARSALWSMPDWRHSSGRQPSKCPAGLRTARG